MTPLRIFIVAGEPSGDILGAKLVAALNSKEIGSYTLEKLLGNYKDSLLPRIMDAIPEIPKLHQQIQFSFVGIGGEEMQSVGVELVYDYSDIAVMGLFEVITSIPRVYLRLQQAYRAVLAYKPDLVITIDSPGFCFRLVEKLRDLLPKDHTDTLFIHYVAPTVWAYKPERAATVKRLYDSIMLILPFETNYFRDMPHLYVGNPVVEDENIALTDREKMIDTSYNKSMISLFPGSRKQELTRHMPILVETIRIISNIHQQNKYTFAIHTLDYLEDYLHDWLEKNALDLIKNGVVTIVANAAIKALTLRCSRLALVKCGTATLNVLAAKVPMIVFYKLSPVSAWIMKKKLQIQNFALANIVLGKKVVPEFIQNDCIPEKLAKAAIEILKDSKKAHIENYYIKLWDIFGANEKQTPSQKAARYIIDLFFLKKII